MKKLIIPLLAIFLFASCTKDLNTKEIQPLSDQLQVQNKNYLDIYMARSSDLQKNGKENINLVEVEKELALFDNKVSELKVGRKQFRADQKVNSASKPAGGVINMPGDYPTLQEAIDNSQPNGEIIINGNYEITEVYTVPSGSLKVVFVDIPGLKIVGAAKSSISEGFIILEAENIQISNLELNSYLVIADSGSGAKILNNTFTIPPNTPSFNRQQIQIRGGATNCLLKDNIIQDVDNTLRWGIWARDSENNSFISNTISGGEVTQNHMFFGQGFGQGTRNNLIQDCILINGGRGGYSALRIYEDRSGNTITGCTIKNVNYSGIVLDGIFDIFAPIGGTNNKIIDCTVSDYSGFGIRVENESFGLISNCIVSNKNADPEKTLGSQGIGMFGTDCKIVDCNSNYNNGGGIVLFGNPTGNGSSNEIINSKANNNRFFGIFYFAGFEENSTAIIEGSEANDNTDLDNFGSVLMQSTSNSSSYTVANCKINNNSGLCTAGLVGFAIPGASANWIFKDNEVSKNGEVGIYLENSTMALVENNKAKGNDECDFDEVNNTGTVQMDNKFGTTCVDLGCD